MFSSIIVESPITTVGLLTGSTLYALSIRTRPAPEPVASGKLSWKRWKPLMSQPTAEAFHLLLPTLVGIDRIRAALEFAEFRIDFGELALNLGGRRDGYDRARPLDALFDLPGALPRAVDEGERVKLFLELAEQGRRRVLECLSVGVVGLFESAE